MSFNYGLRGVSAYSSVNLTSNIEAGLTSFLRYGLELAGATTTVALMDTTITGYSPGRLYPQSDPNYPSHSVFQANRQNWISVSGVTVDNVPYTAHTVDLEGGRILFPSGMGSTTTVRASYVYRDVFVDRLAGNAGLRQLQYGSLNPTSLSTYGSGDYNRLSDTRVQLPAIAIDPVDRREFAPLQLGGGHIITNPVLFHVFAESLQDVQRLTDILSYQVDKPIYLLDTQRIAQSGAYSLSYPQLVDDYKWKLAQLRSTTVQHVDQVNHGLWVGIVRTNVELFMPEL